MNVKIVRFPNKAGLFWLGIELCSLRVDGVFRVYVSGALRKEREVRGQRIGVWLELLEGGGRVFVSLVLGNCKERFAEEVVLAVSLRRLLEDARHTLMEVWERVKGQVDRFLEECLKSGVWRAHSGGNSSELLVRSVEVVECVDFDVGEVVEALVDVLMERLGY